jgi:hypothetical protein
MLQKRALVLTPFGHGWHRRKPSDSGLDAGRFSPAQSHRRNRSASDNAGMERADSELPKPMLVQLFERIAEIMELDEGQTGLELYFENGGFAAGRPAI